MTRLVRRLPVPPLQGAIRSVAAAAVAALLLSGCGAESEPGDGEAAPPERGVTESGFVEHVAALSLALEEGLTGEDARDRVAELGAPTYTRGEIENFTAYLRRDPVRWAEAARRIDERVDVLRSKFPATPDTSGPRPTKVRPTGKTQQPTTASSP